MPGVFVHGVYALVCAAERRWIVSFHAPTRFARFALICWILPCFKVAGLLQSGVL